MQRLTRFANPHPVGAGRILNGLRAACKAGAAFDAMLALAAVSGKDDSMRRLLALLIAAAALLGSVAVARESLGVFDGWGAFRDDTGPRCYAIAEPARASGTGSYATISFWPASRVRAQLYVHLPAAARADRPVMLVVGERRFALIARGTGAWATQRRMDAAIVAAMREAPQMGIAATGRDGTRIAAGWPLAGAATAIDAAALGCVRP